MDVAGLFRKIRGSFARLVFIDSFLPFCHRKRTALSVLIDVKHERIVLVPSGVEHRAIALRYAARAGVSIALLVGGRVEIFPAAEPSSPEPSWDAEAVLGFSSVDDVLRERHLRYEEQTLRSAEKVLREKLYWSGMTKPAINSPLSLSTPARAT